MTYVQQATKIGLYGFSVRTSSTTDINIDFSGVDDSADSDFDKTS